MSRARIILIVFLTGVVLNEPASAGIVGMITYTANPTPTTGDLHVLDPSSGISTQVPLPGLNRVGTPEWSRDGRWIAFTDVPSSVADNLYLVRPDGSNLSFLGNIKVGGQPSFSPDGSQLVVHHSAGGFSLHTINTDGTGFANLGVTGVHPRWSPGGNKIVYSNWATIPFPYQSDIFAYDIGTGVSTQITSRAPNHGFVRAAWSPDGTKLAVSEIDHATGLSDLWVMNSDGSNALNVTSDLPASSESYPSWSPDGQHIIYSSDFSGNMDIWAMQPDGSNRINLTNTPGIVETSPWIGVPEPGTLLLLLFGGMVALKRRRGSECLGCLPANAELRRDGGRTASISNSSCSKC